MYCVNKATKISTTNRGFSSNQNLSIVYRVGSVVHVKLHGELAEPVQEWQKMWLISGLPKPAYEITAPIVVQNSNKAPTLAIAAFDTSGSTQWLSIRNFGFNGTINKGSWVFCSFSYITNDTL